MAPISRRDFLGQSGSCAAHLALASVAMPHALRMAWAGKPFGTVVAREPFGNLELEERKIAWIHGDDKRLLEDIENSGHFDFLFYGHSHHAEQHRTGPTLVVNPGALHRARPKTFVVLDLESGELESVTVELSS